jgi:cytochrome oxidase Cu insertion factor (SCO1/SenC/PrrC family)
MSGTGFSVGEAILASLVFITRRRMLVKIRRWQVWFSGILMAGLWTATAGAAALQPLQLLSPGRQQPAPSFTLPDYRGVPLQSATLHGRVVVVLFWVSW